MSIVMFLEVPGATTDQYDRVNEIMGIHGPEDEPEGLLSHVCAANDDGLLICDVWRSQQELDDFIQSRVAPAMKEVGAHPSPPRLAELHNQLGSR
jgi:hypothetical protein